MKKARPQGQEIKGDHPVVFKGPHLITSFALGIKIKKKRPRKEVTFRGAFVL
ncbi:hypothetical protein X474_18490 [Dethiosulfatarculus sandiegensis]|uniref:Uncharacterized protein n=1 Tax=Dethiosulfatarculus sandiegensis TaxID=1429043 RepID=A0A0D2J337_9BACT|nr:hypothetical protein X474_18490 [Dethiosulfatarculus sandiegensis]